MLTISFIPLAIVRVVDETVKILRQRYQVPTQIITFGNRLAVIGMALYRFVLLITHGPTPAGIKVSDGAE